VLEVGHFGKTATPPQFACTISLSLRPVEFQITLRLAAVLDSLVRVSRRVVLRHFARVLTWQAGSPHQPKSAKHRTPASHAGAALPEYTRPKAS
jgi:hypothetical protein